MASEVFGLKWIIAEIFIYQARKRNWAATLKLLRTQKSLKLRTELSSYKFDNFMCLTITLESAKPLPLKVKRKSALVAGFLSRSFSPSCLILGFFRSHKHIQTVRLAMDHKNARICVAAHAHTQHIK